MLTYVIRRLLYSIVVLIAASILVFLGWVSWRPASGSCGCSRPSPSRRSRTSRSASTSTSRSPSATCYWVKDMLTNKFGTETGRRPADLARPQARDGAHAAARRRRRAARDPHRRRRSACTRPYASTARSTTRATTFSFVGLATPVFWLALMLQVLFVNIYLWFDVRIFYVANLNWRRPRDRGSTSSSTARSISRCR